MPKGKPTAGKPSVARQQATATPAAANVPTTEMGAKGGAVTPAARSGTGSSGSGTGTGGGGGGGGQAARSMETPPVGNFPTGGSGSFNLDQARTQFPQLHLACDEVMAAIAALGTYGGNSYTHAQATAWQETLVRALGQIGTISQRLNINQRELVNA